MQNKRYTIEDGELPYRSFPYCELHRPKSFITDDGPTEDPCITCSAESDQTVRATFANNPWINKIVAGKRIYIAGPMRGLPDSNIPAFLMMERVIRRFCPPVVILNPAKNDQNLDYPDQMRKDIKMVTEADIIVMLTGWQNSQGARVEHKVATIIGLEIRYQS